MVHDGWMRAYGGWSSWDVVRAELSSRLPAATLSTLDRALLVAARWSDGAAPTPHAGVEAARILLDADVTASEVLAAAILCDVVTSGACPIQEVCEHVGADTAKVLARVRPARPAGAMRGPLSASAVALAVSHAQARPRGVAAVEPAAPLPY